MVSVLRQLHHELDAAVFAAYGWNDLWEWHEEAQKGSIHDFQTGATAQLAATPEGFDTAIAAFERALDAEILTRLVALNAQRAEEEANGHIRWLRPEYQNPPAQPALDLPAGKSRTSRREVATKEGRDGSPSRPSSKTKTPWPRTLAERVRAVETALQAAAPITAATLASRFASAKPADIAEILETLATLGRAQRDGDSYSS